MSRLYIAPKKQTYDVFIYNSSLTNVQAAVRGGNVHNDWSKLMVATAGQAGSKTIFFEQDETIPPGAWNLDYTTLRGNGNEFNAGGYTLTFGDNTTISSWLVPAYHSVLLKSTSTTGHICTFTGPFNLLDDTVANVQSSSSYEFFASSYAGQNIIAIQNSGRWSLVSGSTKELFKFTGGAFTQQVIISRSDGAVVSNNTLSSTNSQILIDIIGSVNGNLANYPISNSNFTAGVFVPLTLTNISAAAFYVANVTSSSYTLKSEDGYVRANAASNAITIALPKAVGNGRLVTVKKIDSSGNTVTLDADGTETIDGATTKVLSSQYDSIQILDAASGKWEVVS